MLPLRTMFPSQRFGRYLLSRKLATGGMAEIFLAKLLGAEGFEKEIVVKKILPQWSSNRDFISMLIDEAKIAVQLNHPGIVQVYELGREGETYYIAMEYVHGVDLRRLMQKAHDQKKKIPLDVSLAVFIELLEGLSYAHSRADSRGRPLKIVHRDISPQNILVSFDGNVKITDFGIAKAASRSHETMVGVLKGKFAYMSPEQANQEDLDGRSDLFSAAVVLYELLTGERLFYRGQDIDTLDRVRRGQFSFSEEAERAIPGRLKEILLKALSKERDQRFADANDLREEIVRFARRTKKTLRREKVARFLSTLFEGENRREKDEEQQHERKEQPTSLLLDETQTLGEEVLVQGPTQLLFSPLPPIVPASSLPVRKIFSHQFPLWTGVLFILLATGMFFFFLKGEPKKIAKESITPLTLPHPLKKRDTPPEVVAPITERQVLSAETSLPVASAPPLQLTKPKRQGGFLSVQAIPWGYVKIDGGAKRLETPVSRLPLTAGRHRVEILYEPEGAVVSSHITLAEADEVICVANFRGEKGIRCGK